MNSMLIKRICTQIWLLFIFLKIGFSNKVFNRGRVVLLKISNDRVGVVGKCLVLCFEGVWVRVRFGYLIFPWLGKIFL